MDFYDSFHANPMYSRFRGLTQINEHTLKKDEYNKSVIKQFKYIFAALFATSKHDLMVESISSKTDFKNLSITWYSYI